eukprot:SAG11_NODE_2427_length_3375_cov_53.209402_2_plen_222_part_00
MSNSENDLFPEIIVNKNAKEYVEMDNYENQIKQSGLSINILEYASVKTTVKNISGDITLYRNIGGANRIVSKVIVMNEQSDYANTSLYNKFHSKCGTSFTLNLKYNDRPLYSRDITNFAHAFNQVHNAEALPMFVTGAEYSVQNIDFLSDSKFEGLALNAAASKAPRTYFAMKLDGSRVNATGVELRMTMKGQSEDLINRVYLEQACTLTLKDGKMFKAYV